MVQHQEERLVIGPRSQKLHAEVANDVGAVALDRQFLTGSKELWIPVGPLPWQNHPAIKAGRVAAKMPLADHAGVVAAGLEMLGYGIPRPIKPVEDRHAVLVGVLTSQERRSARRADRVGDKRVGESRPFLGESVEVRGGVHARSVG